MCEDMLRAGYQRFIVDPGVRQAHFPETASKLYTDQVIVQTTRSNHPSIYLYLPLTVPMNQCGRPTSVLQHD